MTANPRMYPAHLLHEHLSQASPDLMRTMLRSFIDTLMSADAVCGASTELAVTYLGGVVLSAIVRCWLR